MAIKLKSNVVQMTSNQNEIVLVAYKSGETKNCFKYKLPEDMAQHGVPYLYQIYLDKSKFDLLPDTIQITIKLGC